MPLDHYVSQVHLKNFYSPKRKCLMSAIRKNDLKSFPTNSDSVCRIESGSTNRYLQDVRAIESFLKGIEPKYNTAIRKLAENQIDAECIYVVAGFVAYVLTCSPAGMRIKSEYLKSMVEEVAQMAEKQELFSASPPELAGESLTQLIKDGKIDIAIDSKYPQAIGINSILSVTNMFGNSTWEVLTNPYSDSPFFTSDFPVTIEETDDPRIRNRVIPLSPSLALRIRPDPNFEENQRNFSFSNFRYHIKKINRTQVTNINRLVVRCAESMVFYRDDCEWIPRFVKKNALFRIKSKTHRIPHGNGMFLWVSEEVEKISSFGSVKQNSCFQFGEHSD